MSHFVSHFYLWWLSLPDVFWAVYAIIPIAAVIWLFVSDRRVKRELQRK